MPAARSPFGSGGAVVAMAHRGGALEAPENSWTSFRRVVSLGYRHIETDVRATRDGVVVVFHDADLHRVTDATGPVRGRTWAELPGSATPTASRSCASTRCSRSSRASP